MNALCSLKSKDNHNNITLIQILYNFFSEKNYKGFVVSTVLFKKILVQFFRFENELLSRNVIADTHRRNEEKINRILNKAKKIEQARLNNYSLKYLNSFLQKLESNQATMN